MRESLCLWNVFCITASLIFAGSSSSAQDMSSCSALELLIERGAVVTFKQPALFGYPFTEEKDCETAIQKLSGSFSSGSLVSGYNVLELEAAIENALVGTRVYAFGDELGEIEDFAPALANNRRKLAIVGVGGFLGLGETHIGIDSSELIILEPIGGSGLIAFTTATEEELENRPKVDLDSIANGNVQVISEAEAEEEEEAQANVNVSTELLGDVRASRKFAMLNTMNSGDFAGFGVIAFRRSPSGTLRDRARHLCNGFLVSIATVSAVLRQGSLVDRQVVTVWPINSADNAAALGEEALSKSTSTTICELAIDGYDWVEGSNEIDAAADFFAARGKSDIAARIRDGDQDGPWLLAWAPGQERGSTSDDVLVLAFDLSYVSTPQEAERAFQAWRVAIEHNSELWSTASVANESWNSAIIRWANMLGHDLNFYERLIE